jgi:hypothetical protein
MIEERRQNCGKWDNMGPLGKRRPSETGFFTKQSQFAKK